MRRSGRLIETQKSHDIPFGVRAVQSGIRIDGIWVSNPSTPLPRLSKLHLPRQTSSDFSTSIINSVSDLESQAAAGSSSRGRSSFRPGEPSVNKLNVPEDASELQGFRTLHQPRRPSHLRFGGSGEAKCDEETLGHLEGYQATKDRLLQKDGDTSSGAMADNECSSPSSCAESILNNINPFQGHQRLSLPQWSTRRSSLMPPPSNGNRSSCPQSSKGDYVSISLHSPDDEPSELYLTPPEFPPEAPLSTMSPNKQGNRVIAALSPIEVTHLTETPLPSRMPSPFIPGALHMNKAVRKVNSGFEVLPAGTFDGPAPPAVKGDGVAKDSRWSLDGGKRPINKLQKKNRTSISSRRASSAAEHV